MRANKSASDMAMVQSAFLAAEEKKKELCGLGGWGGGWKKKRKGKKRRRRGTNRKILADEIVLWHRLIWALSAQECLHQSCTWSKELEMELGVSDSLTF